MTTYIQSRALVEILGQKFGIRVVFGTGGDQSKALEGLKKMFYNPTGFQVLPYHHNYTQSGDYVDTAFFIPAFTFVAREGFIDERGVTNTEKAKKFYNDTNMAIEDPQDQIKDRAEFCFTPEDALALEGDNMFDRVILSQQKALIELHKQGPHISKGFMEWDLEGNVEHPLKDEAGSIAKNMYVAGIDGIDLGQEDTSDQTRDPSKFAVVILKRAQGLENPKIVAIYKDRPEKLREAHLQALRLLWYYNCQAVLESTRVSLLTFFREWKLEDRFLMRRPSSCNPNQENSRQFGAPATEAIIKHQLELLQTFISDYGQDLWFIDFINEALTYSLEKKRKFDLIAAAGMCLLGDEELTLRGMKPRFEKQADTIIKPFGYWVDSQGIRHKGRIPDSVSIKPLSNWGTLGDGRVNGRTSKGIN